MGEFEELDDLIKPITEIISERMDEDKSYYIHRLLPLIRDNILRLDNLLSVGLVLEQLISIERDIMEIARRFPEERVLNQLYYLEKRAVEKAEKRIKYLCGVKK